MLKFDADSVLYIWECRGTENGDWEDVGETDNIPSSTPPLCAFFIYQQIIRMVYTGV